jgi:hypothetical protein
LLGRVEDHEAIGRPAQGEVAASVDGIGGEGRKLRDRGGDEATSGAL